MTEVTEITEMVMGVMTAMAGVAAEEAALEELKPEPAAEVVEEASFRTARLPMALHKAALRVVAPRALEAALRSLSRSQDRGRVRLKGQVTAGRKRRAVSPDSLTGVLWA